MTRESEEGEDVLHVQACRLCPVDRLETGDETCGFWAALVYNREDWVKAVGQGEVSDQIHGHVLERSLFHMRVKPLQRRFLVWKIGLGFLALGTSFDVFFHEFSESGSFVRLLHELPCVQDPWMAPCWAIVDFLQHSSSFLDVVVEKKFPDRQFGVRGGWKKSIVKEDTRFVSRKKSIVKEDTRFVSIHLLVKVLSSGKEISDHVRMTWDVGQFIIKVLKVLDPVGLSASDLLQLAEVLEVLVVGADFNWLCSAKEEGSTTLESE
jgi:hypothetical protein